MKQSPSAPLAPSPLTREPPCAQNPFAGRECSSQGGAPASPLFPADPPLAAVFPLQQAARRLPKECTGWSERASRACVRVCARPPVCVAADFIKGSQPRAAEARQPRVPRPRSCRKPTSIPRRQRGLQRGRGAPGGAAEDGGGGRKLATWLQLGWIALQPVRRPPLRCAGCCTERRWGCGGAGWKGSEPPGFGLGGPNGLDVGGGGGKDGADIPPAVPLPLSDALPEGCGSDGDEHHRRGGGGGRSPAAPPVLPPPPPAASAVPLGSPVRFLAGWLASGRRWLAGWAPGMGAPSRTAAGKEPLLRREGPREPSSKPKRSEPGLWLCTTPSPSGRTASPSTDRCSSLGKIT